VQAFTIAWDTKKWKPKRPKKVFKNVVTNVYRSIFILFAWICSSEEAAQKLIKQDKFVGVKMSPLDKFEFDWCNCYWKGGDWYQQTGCDNFSASTSM
jgi:hypothetical protein